MDRPLEEEQEPVALGDFTPAVDGEEGAGYAVVLGENRRRPDVAQSLHERRGVHRVGDQQGGEGGNTTRTGGPCAAITPAWRQSSSSRAVPSPSETRSPIAEDNVDSARVVDATWNGSRTPRATRQPASPHAAPCAACQAFVTNRQLTMLQRLATYSARRFWYLR